MRGQARVWIIPGAVVVALFILIVVATSPATRDLAGRLNGSAARPTSKISRWSGAEGPELVGTSVAAPAPPLAPTSPSAGQGGVPAPSAPIPSTQANLLPWAFPLTSEFGHYPNGGAHFGLDIGATYGVVQTAPVGGVVEDVLRGCVEGDQRCGLGWGNHVWWKSSETGHHILLAHFSRLEDWVQIGATVKAGAALGVTGSTGFSTGPHVHFQVNTEECCDNASAISPAIEFSALACGASVVGARFGAPCP